MRNEFDLTHFCFQTGQLGRLQTLSVIPIIAGDSISLNMEGIMRLSPLRRQMMVDAHVDLFAFYVPHRHIYGQNWIDFIKGGYDETVTFPLLKSVNGETSAAVKGCFSVNAEFNKQPAWVSGGYAQIWNRYFRSPTWDIQSQAQTGNTYDIDNKSYEFFSRYLDAISLQSQKERTLTHGMLCARLKRPWSTGIKKVPSFADRNLYIKGTVSGGTDVTSNIDILELNKVRARYETEVDRDWFGVRYNDILGKTWKSHVNIDADQRPELIMRKTQWLSGHDVDGTGDANLGQYQGKAASHMRFGFPRKHFSEHGTIFILALMRFPPLIYDEVNPIMKRLQPTYQFSGGDPELFAAQPPINLNTADYFEGDDDFTHGYIPYGQWYRAQPSYISPQFRTLSGFPFIESSTLKDKTDKLGESGYTYGTDEEYNSIFDTHQLHQWQLQSRFDVKAHRVIPGVRSSIYAGAN